MTTQETFPAPKSSHSPCRFGAPPRALRAFPCTIGLVRLVNDWGWVILQVDPRRARDDRAHRTRAPERRRVRDVGRADRRVASDTNAWARPTPRSEKHAVPGVGEPLFVLGWRPAALVDEEHVELGAVGGPEDVAGVVGGEVGSEAACVS